ncbi:hypothetical protein [Flaviaesturariibacter terrae]
MRPSDKVWKGISDRLKRRNRRIGWFTGFFMVAASLSGYLLSGRSGDSPAPGRIAQAGSANASIAGTTRQDRPGYGIASGSADAGTAGSAPVRSLFATNELPQSNFELTASIATHNRRRHAGTRGAASSKTLSDAAPGTDDLASLESAGADELGRLYTDASLAEPYALKLANAAPANPAAKVSLPKAADSRLSVQVFFTPTLSYRSLTENKDFVDNVPPTNADPNTLALYNVNDAVSHKPSLGLEVGVTAKYAFARNLKVQGGVQFNVSRYVVQAFDNFAPQTATMAYNGGGSTQRSTPYSNLDGGGRKENLQNMYFQVSAPVGVELRIAGNERTQFGLTSTIQPTYILSDRVYLLSTDYKSYAEVPWLVRRFNVNTALSTYVGYSTGKLAWQIGPQVRYQLMSSFVSKYPVKENLFDVGLRIGVSLNGKH